MNFDKLKKLTQIKVFRKLEHVTSTHVDYYDRLIDSPSWMIKSEGILFVWLLMVIQSPLKFKLHVLVHEGILVMCLSLSHSLRCSSFKHS